MDLKYKFNAKEYATLNRISASALRKRRLSGKLEGQYIKKGSEYFYQAHAGDRPNIGQFTIQNSRSKNRRRNVHGSETNYHKARNGHQLKLTNDLRQYARLNKSLTESQILEITPDIIEVAKQRRLDRIKKATASAEHGIRKNNYAYFVNCTNKGYTDVRTTWRPLFPKAKDEYDEALENTASSWEGKYY